jgi:hypothetical protein
VELGFNRIDLAEKLGKLALDFYEIIFNLLSLASDVSQIDASVGFFNKSHTQDPMRIVHTCGLAASGC